MLFDQRKKKGQVRIKLFRILKNLKKEKSVDTNSMQIKNHAIVKSCDTERVGNEEMEEIIDLSKIVR